MKQSYPYMIWKLTFYIIASLSLMTVAYDLGVLVVANGPSHQGVMFFIAAMAVVIFTVRVLQDGVLLYVERIMHKRRWDRVYADFMATGATVSAGVSAMKKHRAFNLTQEQAFILTHGGLTFSEWEYLNPPPITGTAAITISARSSGSDSSNL